MSMYKSGNFSNLSYAAVSAVIKKGEYWKAVTDGGSSKLTCYWIPLGS